MTTIPVDVTVTIEVNNPPMREADLRAYWDEHYPDSLSVAAVIQTPSGENAIAIRTGENLSSTWQSGSVIAFWMNGEHTSLDGLEFTVLTFDLFQAKRRVPHG